MKAMHLTAAPESAITGFGISYLFEPSHLTRKRRVYGSMNRPRRVIRTSLMTSAMMGFSNGWSLLSVFCKAMHIIVSPREKTTLTHINIPGEYEPLSGQEFVSSLEVIDSALPEAKCATNLARRSCLELATELAQPGAQLGSILLVKGMHAVIGK